MSAKGGSQRKRSVVDFIAEYRWLVMDVYLFLIFEKLMPAGGRMKQIFCVRNGRMIGRNVFLDRVFFPGWGKEECEPFARFI